MGCLRLTYDHDREPLPFLGVWKKERLENIDAHFLGTPDKKSRAENFCDSYLPFGMSFNHSAVSPENLYKYNGKEEQKETGWLAYGFRFYDPELGRFFGVDPIADQFVHVTPYNYAENEPVSSIDLWGLQRLKVNGRERTSKKDIRTGGAAVRHPVAASRTGQVERGGTNISSVSGRIARHAAEGGNMSVKEGSERNALRHGIWSASITSEFGRGKASRLTNAHEGIGIGADVEIDMTQQFQKSDLNFADDMVDLLNNQIGMDVGENMEGASAKDIAKGVLDVYVTEGLWEVTETDGGYTVSRKTITQEQYDSAVDRLNSMDENGMTEEDRKSLEK